MDLTERIDQPELMDTTAVPLHHMEQILKFLKITNQYFGGNAVVLKYLKQWSRNWDKNQTIKILDVGTGGGDIPMAITQWARKNGFNLHMTGIDLMPEVAAVALSNTKTFPEISIYQKDFFDLKKEGKTFDYVTASLFLHHIPPAQAVATLQAFDEVSTRGMIVSDLQRSYLSYKSVSILSHLIGNKIVKHDGPLSVRRAFTVDELNELAKESHLTYLKGSKEPWFRVSLSGEK